MPQPDHSAPRGPKRRTDSTRPASTRRGGDRRPYPTASTTTRVSPAKPGSTTTRPRSRGAAGGPSQPIPATVWTAGPEPIDLDTSWPTPIVSTIVAAFSEPGARVVLLPWPPPRATPGDRRRPDVAGPRAVNDHAHGTDPADGVTDALTAVESLRRNGRVVRIAAVDNLTGPASRPFWADLVGDPRHAPATIPPLSPSGPDDTVLDGPDGVPADTDLIITSLRPEDGGTPAVDLVALVAARLLRVGGILAVLTHSDWSPGELSDPTGAVIASAQNADLLYLQHIVALHTPVRSGRLTTEPPTVIDTPATGEQTRVRCRTTARRLPAPHRRIHSDVLVFAQPHDYEPLAANPTGQASENGVIR